MEFLYYVVAETAAAEILHTYRSAIYIVEEDVVEIFHRPFVDDEHTLTVVLLPLLLFAHLALTHFDVVFVGEPFQRLHIRHLLMFHEETDGICRLSA